MLCVRDRILGGLWGLLIGDALGVPYEFNEPEDLPEIEQIEYQPPLSFVRSHNGVLPGTWYVGLRGKEMVEPLANKLVK